MGHDVRLAADGVQALEVAEAWAPEFVILDVHMPKIDGYTIARKLRARFPPGKMQLVMMSGTDLDQTTLSGAKQAGFDHCVDKTFAVKGLDALLRGKAPPIPA
jgi:CheY-like chemotaxis protein